MTLSVATVFPWTAWLDEAPSTYKAIWRRYPHLRPAPGLIFVADSRWSYPAKGVTHDGAIKVAAVDRVAAATYAGNTDVGEIAIAWLTQYFSRSRAHVDEGDLTDVLRSAWRRYGRGIALQFALGFITESLEPLLFRLDSWNNFRPVEVPGMTCLGMPDAIKFFRAEIGTKVSQTWGEDRGKQSVDLSPDGWASVTQSIVWLAGEKQVDRSVGGPPTCLVVDKNGVRGLSLFVVDPTPEPSGRQVSLAPEDAEKFYGHPWRRRRRLPFKWQGTASR